MTDQAHREMLVEAMARALAPLAWAALGTGDTLAQQNRRTASLRHARAALDALTAGPAFEAMVERAQVEGAELGFLHEKSWWRAVLRAALAPDAPMEGDE